MKRTGIPVLLCALMVLAHSMLSGQTLTGAAILERVEQTFTAVQDYTASFELSVSMDRLRIPRSSGTIFFKQPNKFHFESKQFLMMPREGLFLNPSQLRKDYTPVLDGKDTVNGQTVHRIRLQSSDPKKPFREFTAYVDPASWTIVRLSSKPYEGRKVTVTFTYMLVDGKFWVAKKLEGQFEAPTAAAAPQESSTPDPSQPPMQSMQQHRGNLRNGSVSITYSEYRINTGLDDAIFEKKDTK